MSEAEQLAIAQAEVASLQAQLDGSRKQNNDLLAEGRALVAEKDILATRMAARTENSKKSRSTVKMPVYKKDGTEDFLLFYSKFKAWKTLHNLEDEEAKLSLFMSFEGQAGAIARIFGPETKNFKKEYKEYVDAIKNLFSARADSEAAKSAFESRIQQNQESVQTYAAHKLAMFHVAYPDNNDEAHLTREYIRGLTNPKVREEVVLHSHGRTYEEIVEKARDAEAGYAYLATLNRATRPTEQVPPRVSLAQAEPMEMGSLNAILAAVQGLQRDQNGRFVKDGGCWECGDPNHMKRNCPKLPPLPPAWRGKGRGFGRGRGGWGRGGRWGNRGGRGGANNGNRVMGAITEATEGEQQQGQKAASSGQTTEQPINQLPDFIQQQQQLLQTFNPAMGNF